MHVCMSKGWLLRVFLFLSSGTFCWIWDPEKGCSPLWPVRKKPGNSRCPLWKEGRCPQGHETVQWHPTWWYATNVNHIHHACNYYCTCSLWSFVIIITLIWCLCLFRAAYEHTTRHITDRHTKATYAGVSLAAFCSQKLSLEALWTQCVMGILVSVWTEVVEAWTEIVGVALEACREDVEEEGQVVPEEGVEVEEEAALASSSYQQRNSTPS